MQEYMNLILMQLLLFFDTGHACTMFSKSHKSVMRIDDFYCRTCPFGYNTINAFKCKYVCSLIQRP